MDENYLDTRMQQYLDMLMDYNTRVNLVSRKMTPEGLRQLLDETLLLERYVSPGNVVDAGSGNGLLGIPLAIRNDDWSVVVVEPIGKKAVFLEAVKKTMELGNLEVRNVSIEEYLKKKEKKRICLVSRGFPRLEVFVRYIQNGLIRKAVVITSDNKIKKNQIHLESVGQKTYNVPLRDHLKILKMEKIRRDTEKRM